MDSAIDRDAVTVRLLVHGDPEGLRRLLADHGTAVRTTITREFRDALDELQVDEALSQASQRVWKSGHRFDAALGTLRAWFYVIARNCARRQLLIEKRNSSLRYVEDLDSAQVAARRPESAAPVDDDDDGGTDAAPNDASLLDDLRECIEALPRMQRAIVLADLAAGGSAPGKELAEHLDTTPNSIYVSRIHARKALRRALLERGHRFDGPEGGTTERRPAGRSQP